MFRVAIVEDDQMYIRQLEEFLDRYAKEYDVKLRMDSFLDGEALIEQFQAKYDLIFMDIQMQFMDGLKAAEKIREMDKRVVIVFVTNSLQYAIRGYAVNALDYVVKPINYFKFSQVMKRALESLSEDDQKYVTLHTGDGMVKVALRDIYYVESRHHVLCYVTKNGEYIVRGSLSDCIRALEPYGFYQVQKSYVVNMRQVEQIKTASCVVHGMEIMLSRKKKKDFMQKMFDYMGDVIG